MAKFFKSEIYQLARELLSLVEAGPDGIRVRAGKDALSAGIVLQRFADQLDRDAAVGTLAPATPATETRHYHGLETGAPIRPGDPLSPYYAGALTAAEAAGIPVVDVEIRLPPFNPPPDGLRFIDSPEFR
jgi:hypothetical protein